MYDAAQAWSELLNRYLFHWTADRALWIGGHTLSWDARCAGIYIGFGAGVLCRMAAGRAAARMPSGRTLLLAALFMLPLFGDVAAIAAGIKSPSNDTRYLTGLLWGAAFSVLLYPAFLILTRVAVEAPPASASWAGLAPLGAAAGAWLLKGWDHAIAYGLLEATAVFGSLSLAGILLIGLFQAVRYARPSRGTATSLMLAATAVLLSACATPQPTVRTGSCTDADFEPSPAACLACKQEMCIDGRIVTVDDLTALAPVDDWAEERFCLRHPINCYRANALKQDIQEWQKRQVGVYWADDGLHNGLGDAARHVYLLCELTEQFGAPFARALGTAHEEDSEYLIFLQQGVPSNPCCEKLTDLFNNEIGIGLAGQPGTCEAKTLRALPRLRHSNCETRDKVLER